MKRPRTPQEYIERRTERITETGCWIWTGSITGSKGYGYAFWRWQRFPAHRLAWTAFRGPIPDNTLVLHHCDIPTCCNPAHLFLGTHHDNMRDMTRKRRQAVGERHGSAKLTPEQVLAIRNDRRKIRTIAAEYGIGKSMVDYIRRRVAWKHLP